MCANYHNTRRKEITALHKEVKYPIVETLKEFNEAYEDLMSEKYYSVQAEKKRMLRRKFNIILYKDDKQIIESYKSIILSFLGAFDVYLDYEEIKKISYVKYKKNFVKIELIEEELFFRTTYIENDAIYTDEFYFMLNKGRYKLRVSKFIKLPFTQDPMSQYSWLGKYDFWRQFRIYKDEIKKGVL